MNLDEKRQQTIAELLAAMRQVLESNSLRNAKLIARVAIRNVDIIAREGRVPTLDETKEWLRNEMSN